MSGEILLILLIVALIALWLDSGRSYDIAYKNAQRTCRQQDLDFLDDSVALKKIRIRRAPQGGLKLYRAYDFEFTSDGSQRYRGTVHMLGRQLIELRMDAYRIFEE